jgi:hypothetical protein
LKEREKELQNEFQTEFHFVKNIIRSTNAKKIIWLTNPQGLLGDLEVLRDESKD